MLLVQNLYDTCFDFFVLSRSFNMEGLGFVTFTVYVDYLYTQSMAKQKMMWHVSCSIWSYQETFIYWSFMISVGTSLAVINNTAAWTQMTVPTISTYVKYDDDTATLPLWTDPRQLSCLRLLGLTTDDKLSFDQHNPRKDSKPSVNSEHRQLHPSPVAALQKHISIHPSALPPPSPAFLPH